MSTFDIYSETEITDGENPSTAVVEAVSSVSETPAVELPPLYDAVDPDALDALLSSPLAGGEVTFRYAECAVTVGADRTVEVSTGV